MAIKERGRPSKLSPVHMLLDNSLDVVCFSDAFNQKVTDDESEITCHDCKALVKEYNEALEA